ncbi:uncharacterized protein L203_100893 [Cryptococcus depauperatus CBS 7841]|uniref:M-phase inducer phosphatase n=1 Tax=Cryptococcus depauperatus CBS 7841 TaxID=1295531 RepID=A0A1E3I990_9TREE|nr:tyrosine phosphatase [Cryptococcus depauperatus CBS 7841]
MTALGSSPIANAFSSPHYAEAPSPARTETDFVVDVDQSFNSSLCLSDSPYFSPTPATTLSKVFGPAATRPAPPPAFSLRCRQPNPVPTQLQPRPAAVRSASTTEITLSHRQMIKARSFGMDVTNHVAQRGMELKNNKGKMLPPAVPEGRMLKIRGSVRPVGEDIGEGSCASFGVSQTEGMSVDPASDAMDVDSPVVGRRGSLVSSPAFNDPLSLSGSPGLGSFFCESPAPPSHAAPAKRRSLVKDVSASPSTSSPSAKRTSLGLVRPPLDKATSSGALLFGNVRSNTLASRRGTYKRPALGPLASASGDPTRVSSASSAFPILYGPPKQTLGSTSGGTFPRAAIAPMRRAFSVCDQNTAHEMDEDESEFENSPSLGVHAEYARRYSTRIVPRIDGSPGCKATRASIAASGEEIASPIGKGKKISPYGPGGLPGFGDNEIDGKILPCHKVKEDGLVRITPNTLNDLLAGKYTEKIKRYHVLDCRFDYEYEGGHIEGAINVNSMDALDKLLLSNSDGLHASGESLPVPSRSGQLPDGQSVVLVFHCEFSAKRAPTFAKHLRSRDRLLNNVLYPKIYYPEIYILEGGYCGFYRNQPERCDPRGYTPMDDPKHFERRDSDLHVFRKFARTRSFTYGEQQNLPSSRPLPPCPPLAFAAASAATARRNGSSGNGTITEERDHENDSFSHAGDSSAELDASPCPRQVASIGHSPIFVPAKTRTTGRISFSRVASYAGTSFQP